MAVEGCVEHWLIGRRGRGDEHLSPRRVQQVGPLVTVPHFPRILPSVGFLAPLWLGICSGQRGVSRHDTCRSLKCAAGIVHTLLALTFYLDKKKSFP